MGSLYKHQQAKVDEFPKRELLAWSVRTGKTRTAIGLGNKADTPALIIVPKQLKNQWLKELDQHSTVDTLVITKEEFRRDAKTLPKYDTVIVDEAHHFSGMTSTLSKYLSAYIKKHDVTHVYLLTGTPYRSTPWNIYRLGQILGHKWDYFKFRTEFFDEKYLGRRVIWQPKKDCQEALAAKVREIGSIVRLEDCTDMPTDPVPEIITVPLTDEQHEALKELKETESNPLTRFQKAHQIASGVWIGDGYVEDRLDIPCNKDAVILEKLEEYGRGLIFCKYNTQIERYRRLFESEGIPCVVINGATKDIEATRAEARAMEYGAVLVQMACSEGYDFSGFSLTIYPSLSYSFLDFEQSQGRTKHMAKRVPNTYVIINAEKSNDLPVWMSISNKQSFSEAIYLQQHGIVGE